MTERLVLIEFEDEANAYLAAREKDKSAPRSIEDHIISLSLPVQLILQKNGIPYENTLAYFDNDAHARAMEQSGKWLNLFESFDGLEESFIYESSYCIRLVINYLLWVTGIIARAYEKYQPPVFFGPPGRVPGSHFHWKISPQYRPLGFLMMDFAGRKGIGYECFSKETAVFPSPSMQVRPDFSTPFFLCRQLSFVGKLAASGPGNSLRRPCHRLRRGPAETVKCSFPRLRNRR